MNDKKVDLRPFKVKSYKGGDLEGYWTPSIKLDGVMALKTPQGWFSRTGKPLYNLPIMFDNGVYEVYLGSFEHSLSAIKTYNGIAITHQDIYKLYPEVEERILLPTLLDPTEKQIMLLFKEYHVLRGHEGIVLYQGDKVLRVKNKDTIDLEVIGWEEGKGKYAGKLGAVTTRMCKVGTGFTDEQRDWWDAKFMIGKVIEVAYMEQTEVGSLRHPRFIRLRPDKE